MVGFIRNPGIDNNDHDIDNYVLIYKDIRLELCFSDKKRGQRGMDMIVSISF